MSYLSAMEHAEKQKEKIADTQGAISTLWRENKVLLVNGYGEKFTALFSRIQDYLDITLFHNNEHVGFITLKLQKPGKYSIVNNTRINPHTAITHTAGHGLAIKENYRKRGLGATLLSLGIGIAQKDYKEKESTEKFIVLATDVTESGFGCYKNFGFQMLEGMTVTEGSYTNSNQIPEIKILRKKASFWERLIKRFTP